MAKATRTDALPNPEGVEVELHPNRAAHPDAREAAFFFIDRHWPRAGDRWHLDEVFLRTAGRLQYLWRAVGQDGEVLDILVQPRRDKRAAKRFRLQPAV